MYKLVKSQDSTFVLGSLMCKICQSNVKSRKYDDSDGKEKMYYPSESIIDCDEKRIRREKLDNLTEIFEISWHNKFKTR